MSFTYTNNPAENKLDAVRLLVGDTDDSEPLLQDEVLAFLIATWASKNSVYYIAAQAAYTIAAKFAREISISADSQSLSTGELQQKYLDLAGHLMSQHETLLSGGVVDVGGINAWEQPDVTVVPPSFGKGMHVDLAAGWDQGDIADYRRGYGMGPGWNPLREIGGY